jgi:hypothetical protein
MGTPKIPAAKPKKHSKKIRVKEKRRYFRRLS